MINKNSLEVTDEGLVLRVRVIPNSSKNELIVDTSGLKIKTTSPPVENKANKSICIFLAKSLKISKSSVQIISGQLSKDKAFLIEGVSLDHFNKVFSLDKKDN